MTLLPYNFKRSTGAKAYLRQLYIPFSVKRVVPLFRLDSLFTENIDLLKVDVEGMAWDVLIGLGELRPRAVQFEWGFAEDMEKHTLADFARFFASWGYKLEEIDWDRNYGNYLAAPPEVLRILS